MLENAPCFSSDTVVLRDFGALGGMSETLDLLLERLDRRHGQAIFLDV